MTGIAFYAPMKPPTHPTPSGDRTMARNLLAALSRAFPDDRVALVSELQTRDGAGDPARQGDLAEAARHEATRLIARGGWRLWVTYHNYYKAPDLLGPTVSAALDIPYVLIEATRARKRLGGPWDDFARAAEAACDRAQVIFHLTARDREALEAYGPPGQQIVHLRPFLPRDTLPDPAPRPTAPVVLAAAMFRAGDKLASYRLIAQCLPLLTTPDWRLDIAGDGPARPEIAALFAPFGDRVRLLGRLNPDDMQTALANARALVWPGVNEAFGMVYLEAQAAGRPVVAQDRPGLRDVVAPGALVPQDDLAAMAARIDRLLTDDPAWTSAAADARAHAALHLADSARDTLARTLGPLLERAA